MTSTRAWLLSLLLLGTGTAGCSAIGVTARPANAATLPYFECTSDYVLPVVDAAFVAAYAGLAIGNYHLQETNGGAWFVGSPGMTVLLIGAAVPFALSLAYGVHTVSQCRQAKDDLMFRSSQLPAAYPVPAAEQAGARPSRLWWSTPSRRWFRVGGDHISRRSPGAARRTSSS